jgi:hypothetical protein
MKNVFIRAGRFLWSWRFLKILLGIAALVIFFYVEEDWRGARAWAATKAKWEAQGETFDIQRLAPTPVPDDQNLGALPLFKMEPDPDPNRGGYLALLTLRKTFAWDWVKSNLPSCGMWERGEPTDAEKNRALVAAAYAVAFKNAPSSQDAFAQFSALVPAVADLRAAAAERPYCRFEENYRFDLPGESSLALITAQITLSKFLTADAVLALDAKKPDVALADILVHDKLMSGTLQQPLLVTGLVAIGMEAINHGVIYEGLARHVWNDGQLAELEQHLAQVDFLASYQKGLRGEACLMIAFFERLKPQREILAGRLHQQGTAFSPRDWTPILCPDGWIDLMKVRSANFDLTAAGLVDLQSRTLSPSTVFQFAATIEKRQGFLFGDNPGPINSAAQKFAIAQVRVDETRIVCALERYRLARGVYPGSLEVLAPQYIDDLPHDIIDGKPYHYQLRADGSFQLYSVGWNQTDDGGEFALKKDSPKQIDYKNGDWPWPTPK